MDVAVFIDGPIHDTDHQHEKDEQARMKLENEAGWLVLRFHHTDADAGWLQTMADQRRRVRARALRRMTVAEFPAGTLVRARGRDWLVLPGAPDGLLLARPLGGRDDETTVLLPEFDAPTPAVFDAARPSTTAATPPGPGCFATLCGCPSAPPAAPSARSATSRWPPGTTSSCR